jgi:hypothetical protein
MTDKKDFVIEQLPERDRGSVTFLIALLKSRLQAGSDDNFDTKDMVNWIIQSLSAFNSHPPCTYYKLSDLEFISYFSDVLVGYAAYLACDSQALKESGRETTELSHCLQVKAQNELEAWKWKINIIKNNGRFYEEWVRDADDKE